MNTEFSQFNHPPSHPPEQVRLVNGALNMTVSTTIGCAWKYGQSFFVATWRANAACLRWLYWVSASVKDFLTKNTGLYLLFSSSLNRAALTETSETARCTKSVSPTSGLARTGGFARYYLIVVRASSHSSFHPARMAPLRVAKNGFRWSINREINHPRVANWPVNYCTSFLKARAGDSRITLS